MRFQQQQLRNTHIKIDTDVTKNIRHEAKLLSLSIRSRIRPAGSPIVAVLHRNPIRFLPRKVVFIPLYGVDQQLKEIELICPRRPHTIKSKPSQFRMPSTQHHGALFVNHFLKKLRVTKTTAEGWIYTDQLNERLEVANRPEWGA